MSYEEAKKIINNMDWSKLSDKELEAISTMVKIAAIVSEDDGK